MTNEEANNRIREILRNITSGVISRYDIPEDIREYITCVDIPDTIEKIDDETFENCESLEFVSIPDSVKVINFSTFRNCFLLKSVTIPSSVIEIGYSAFENCESLNNINIPDYLIEIADRAFYNCISLESINIPNSVIDIGYSAFYKCYNLKVIFSASSPLIDKILSTEKFENCSYYCQYIGLNPETQIKIKSTKINFK